MYARTHTRKNNTDHCVAHWRGQFCCVFKCSVVHTWSLKILNVVLCADTVCCIPSVVLSVGMKNCTLCWHGMLYWYWVFYCALAWSIELCVDMECSTDIACCIVLYPMKGYSCKRNKEKSTKKHWDSFLFEATTTTKRNGLNCCCAF